MKFFDEINEIMGNKPSVNPPVVIDTLDSSTETVNLDVKASIVAAKGKDTCE